MMTNRMTISQIFTAFSVVESEEVVLGRAVFVVPDGTTVVTELDVGEDVVVLFVAPEGECE